MSMLKKITIIFFALFLVISKAPIFFVAGVVVIWYLWKAPRERLCASIIVASLLVLINIAGWILAPRPPGPPLSVSFATPISFRAISEINEVRGWFIPDVVYNFLSPITPKPVFTLVVVIYILIKYYAVYFLASPLKGLSFGNKNDVFGMNFRDRLIGIDLYVFVSLFAWIFVRHGGAFSHVAHAYLLMAFLCLLFCVQFNLFF